MVLSGDHIRDLEASKLRQERFVRRLVKKIVAPANDEHRDEALAELAERLAAEWSLDLAREVAMQILEWPGDKAALLAEIGGRWASLGRADSAEHCFRAAQEVAQECEASWQVAEALLRVARKLTAAGLKSEARRVLEEARQRARSGEAMDGRQDSLDASAVLGEIAQELVVAGDVEGALRTARAISNWGKRTASVDRIELMLRSKQTQATPFASAGSDQGDER